MGIKREIFVSFLFLIFLVSWGGARDTSDCPRMKGNKKYKVVHTRKVAIQDEEGRVWAKIEVDENEPDMLLFDRDGDGQVVLNKEERGRLEVYDKKGRTRLRISGTGIEMYDENELPRVRWSSSGIRIYDKKGKVRISWSGLGIGLFDERGRLRLRLSPN